MRSNSLNVEGAAWMSRVLQNSNGGLPSMQAIDVQIFRRTFSRHWDTFQQRRWKWGTPGWRSKMLRIRDDVLLLTTPVTFRSYGERLGLWQTHSEENTECLRRHLNVIIVPAASINGLYDHGMLNRQQMLLRPRPGENIQTFLAHFQETTLNSEKGFWMLSVALLLSWSMLAIPWQIEVRL